MSLVQIARVALAALCAALSFLVAPAAWGDLAAPVVSFSPTTITAGSNATLTILLDNNPPGNPNNIAFTANYPANLFNAATPGGATTCNAGTATAGSLGTSLSLGGTSISGNSNCTVTVSVTSCNAGTYIVGGFVVTSSTNNPTAGSATLTVTGNSPGDADTSTVSAAPGSVPANGVTTATITVTLRSFCGTPVSGKTITLGQGVGSSIISPASAVTNASGVATFTVRNSTPQMVTYTATDVTDSVVITQTAAVTFTQQTAPTVVKSFSPTATGTGLSSTLSVTITNPNAAGSIAGLAFTDTYPGTLVNAAVPGLTNTCGGTASATAGGTQLTLSGGTVAASSSCTVSVSVTSAIAGSYNNSTGAVTSTNAGSGTAAAATLIVNGAPGVAKSFSPASIGTGQTSTLTITLTNTNTVAITGVAFTDGYPANLVNAAVPGLTNTCGGAASAVAGGTQLTLNGGTIPASSSCTVSVSVTSAVAGSYNNGTGIVSATNAGNGGPASAILTVSVSVSSFNMVEPGGDPVTGLIFTKIAGQDIVVDIVARDASNNVATAFTGIVAVELVDNTSGGACPGLPLIKALANQTFTGGDAGRHPLSAGQFEANAWRNVLFRVKYPTASPTVTSCSSDAFANRPLQFVSVLVRDANRTTAGTTNTLNNTSNPGTGNVHNAGQPFRIDATAQNGAGTPATTTLYSPGAGQPVAILAQCGAGAVCPAAPGTLSLGTWSAASGIITTTTASYSDVGAFNLTLEDQTFSSVDAGDGTSTAVRYISSGAITAGRFVPDHFTLAAGASITPRSDIGACSGSLFTYMGERMDLVFTLNARASVASGGALTPSYSGATLGALALNSAASYNFGAIDSATPTPLTSRLDLALIGGITATWAGGTASIIAPVAISRAAMPDGLYAALKIGAAPADPDGVALLASALNLDADNNATPERAQIGAATEVRFGRLRLQNSYGPDSAGQQLPLDVQYWNGSSFALNTLDSCTSLARANIALAFTGTIAACNTAVLEASVAFASGLGKLTLAAPGAGKTGTVTLTPILGAAGAEMYCTAQGVSGLQAGVSSANAGYLRGKWTGATWDENPTGRATFGLYGSQPRNFIFFRENY